MLMLSVGSCALIAGSSAPGCENLRNIRIEADFLERQVCAFALRVARIDHPKKDPPGIGVQSADRIQPRLSDVGPLGRYS
ncbi:MAG: hypothetical protein WAK98_09365, partial [Gemmobacter sp.]